MNLFRSHWWRFLILGGAGQELNLDRVFGLIKPLKISASDAEEAPKPQTLNPKPSPILQST